MRYIEQLELCKLQIENVFSKAEAVNIATMLLDKYTNSNNIKTLEKESIIIEEKELGKIKIAIEQLLQHRPIQYILEESWFYKFSFYVNENVLIPRPETEELVYETIKIITERKIKKPTILEIGTGSGCIAISLKKELEDVNIFAVDISDEALNVAKKNAKTLQTEINFFNLDFLDKNNWNKLPTNIDLIISNPPYIAETEKNEIQPNVLDFEPHLALFVPDDNALVFYKNIIEFANQLNQKPIICCEINQGFGKEVVELFSLKYDTIILKKDMQQKDRMVFAIP